MWFSEQGALHHVSRVRHAFPSLFTRRAIIISLLSSSSDKGTSQLRCLGSSTFTHFTSPFTTAPEMNDPGLHEPAQEAAQDVEKNEQEEDDQAEQEEQEFLDPRWGT
jgi:hypothetical protein